MAFFQSALNSAVKAVVDATPGSIRTSLYGAANQLLSKARGGPLLAGDHLIPIGGLADGNFRFARFDKTGSIATGEVSLLLHEPFEGATVSSPNRITLASTIFVQTQTATAGLNFNSSNLTTGLAAALLTSNKQFLRTPGSPMLFQIRARAAHIANSVIEFGFGQPANQTSPPTVGAFWQVTAAGVVHPVWTYNGTDVTGEDVAMPVDWRDKYYQWSVLCMEEEFAFFIIDPSTNLIVNEQRISIVNTAPKGWNASHLPVFARLHNVTAPATAPTLLITRLDVYGYDFNHSFPFAAQLAFSGYDSATNPTTFAQSANYASAAAPTTAVLTAATPSYTTLGGQFQLAAVAGAETDFPLFAFTVPAPYSFICTGVDIDVINTVVAVATTPTVFQWQIVADSTSGNIATAGIRRVALGMQSFIVGSAAGAQAQRLSSNFFLNDCPLVTSPGRLLLIGLKIPIGTATATEIFRGTVTVKGFFY